MIIDETLRELSEGKKEITCSLVAEAEAKRSGRPWWGPRYSAILGGMSQQQQAYLGYGRCPYCGR